MLPKCYLCSCTARPHDCTRFLFFSFSLFFTFFENLVVSESYFWSLVFCVSILISCWRRRRRGILQDGCSRTSGGEVMFGVLTVTGGFFQA